uniref:Uncharacterized protein n=1 Tax=Anopheles stephensi TaxID=30069 RepID=A0A182XYV4_ANOST
MHGCEEDCISRYYQACETGTINMTSDAGWKKLLRIVERDTGVHVQKLIVPISPSGQFLQRITHLFDRVMYVSYREPTFHIPEGNTIEEIVIMSAEGLNAIVAGPNTHLDTLSIQQCTLNRLPQTLPKMVGIKLLSITMCMLAGLRLDVLVENQNLISLDLSYNQIRQIFPVSKRSGKTISLKKLILTANQLDHLDMSIFASMSQLESLQLMHNRLTHLELSTPLILPQLRSIYLLDNLLVSIDLRNATLPNFSMLSVTGNAMYQMPLLPKALPQFDYIALSENNLTRVDLSYFRPYRQLKNIYLSSNQITTVLTSSPVKLPAHLLRLERNKIQSINFTGCDMPNITVLNLAYNRLTAVPPVFDRYPKVQLTMDENPLRCDALLPYKDTLQSGRLLKDSKSISWTCNTPSSFLISEKIKVCCVG